MFYEIDDYRASGSHAILLLSILARMRSLRAPQLPCSLHNMIAELDDNAHDPKKPISFSQYLAPPATKELRINSDAAHRFANYIAEMMRADELDALIKEPSTPQSITASFSRPIDSLLARLLIDDAYHSPHPDYAWKDNGTRYWVRAYSETSLKLTLLGVSPSFTHDNPESGVFHVVREARGVFRNPDSSGDRVTCLVRELLWLRHTAPSEQDEKGWKGCYFSAVNNGIYLIDKVDIISRGQLQLYGRKMLDAQRHDDHHFYLSMPSLTGGRHASPHRLGLLCGSTTLQIRPAAWKIAVLVPPNQKVLSLALETIVQQLVYSSSTTAKQSKTCTDLYDKLVAAHTFLHARQEIGVLAAHSLALKETEQRAHLSRLRRAFKGLVATDMPVIVDEVTTQLFCDLLNDNANLALQELKANKSARSAAERLLQNILQSWPMLEPVHLFAPLPTDAKAEGDASRTGSAIEMLLSAKPSVPDIVVLKSPPAKKKRARPA